MRKVLSFVLVLSLVLGSFSMAFAAAPKDVVGLPSEEAVTVLSDLGVVSGYEDGTYKPENIVTRAEMAVLIIRALGLQDYVTTTAKSKFPDMAGYSWAEGYIAYAESLGMLSGYPDGTFKPGRTVSYDEAASMLVRALGYSAESLPGSWPANFIVKAKALGILDGIQAGAAGANRGDVAIMLYQTVDQPIGSINKDGEWVNNNKTDDETKNDTMLSRLGAQAQDPKVINADDVEKASINIKKYLGAYAVTYIKDKKIIAVGEVKSTFLTGDYNSTDDILKVGDIEYKGITDSTDVTTGGAYFLNGEEKSSLTNATIDLTTDGALTFAVELSGKTVKTVYSIAKWTVDDHFLFEKAMLEDDNLNDNAFTLDDDDEIDLNSFELVGVASLDKIEKDNVVYVYTANSEITKIEVGTATVKGTVTRATTAANPTYTIDGKGYKVAKINGSFTTEVEVGQEGTALLDVNGKIYDWDVDSASAGNYGVVVGEVQADSRGNLTVVLVNKAGEEVTYPVRANATSSGAFDVTSSTAAIGQLVEFAVNKDGRVTEIKALTDSAISGNVSKNGTLIGTTPLDAGAVVFVHDDGDYSVSKVADLDRDYDFTAVNTVAYVDGKIKAIIVEKDAAGKADAVYGVINTVAVGYLDNEKVDEITAIADGKKLVALVEKGVTGAVVTPSNGAIQKITLNADGVVTKIEAIAASDSEVTPVTNFAVTKVSGELVQDGTDSYAIDSKANIYVWDDKEEEFVKRSISALRNKTVSLYQLDKDSEGFDLVIAR